MQLVGELVGLGPQGVGGGPGGAQFTLQGGQLGPVPQGGDGADVAALGPDGHPVQDHQPLPHQHQLVRVRLVAGEDDFQCRVHAEGIASFLPTQSGGQAQQFPGAVVGHGDPLVRVQRHHAFLQARAAWLRGSPPAR